MQSMQLAVMIKCVEDLNHSNFGVSGEQSETRVNQDNDFDIRTESFNLELVVVVIVVGETYMH